jgi:uncharacterized membrane protein YbaN (DUF454 family)
MNKKIACYLYSCLGFIATGLGIIGVFLPLMPTTCFLIVAVWAFSKSNPAIAKAILNHPRFGPTIRNWMTYKTIKRQTKYTISISIIIGFSITLLLATPPLKISAFLVAGMLVLLLYINTRAEHNMQNVQAEEDTLKLPTQKLVS